MNSYWAVHASAQKITQTTKSLKICCFVFILKFLVDKLKWYINSECAAWVMQLLDVQMVSTCIFWTKFFDYIYNKILQQFSGRQIFRVVMTLYINSIGVSLSFSILTYHIIRDQLNSRFHGRDIFREIGLLPWKNADFREIRDFSWILVLLVWFMTIKQFYQQLLYGCCCLPRVALQH